MINVFWLAFECKRIGCTAEETAWVIRVSSQWEAFVKAVNAVAGDTHLLASRREV